MPEERAVRPILRLGGPVVGKMSATERKSLECSGQGSCWVKPMYCMSFRFVPRGEDVLEEVSCVPGLRTPFPSSYIVVCQPLYLFGTWSTYRAGSDTIEVLLALEQECWALWCLQLNFEIGYGCSQLIILSTPVAAIADLGQHGRSPY